VNNYGVIIDCHAYPGFHNDKDYYKAEGFLFSMDTASIDYSFVIVAPYLTSSPKNATGLNASGIIAS